MKDSLTVTTNMDFVWFPWGPESAATVFRVFVPKVQCSVKIGDCGLYVSYKNPFFMCIMMQSWRN